MKDKIKISDHFSYSRLLRFTLPSIAMMVFVSIYGIVDGFFISNYVGKTPFAASNFVIPFLMMLGIIGFMFGTGGGALIAKTMGEGDYKKARSIFSLLVYLSFLSGIVIAILSYFFLPHLLIFLGAEGEMLKDGVLYGRIVIFSVPFFILQYEFQSFFVVAGKPKLGFYVTLCAGLSNIILDFLLVAVIPLGLVGAAFATVVSELVGGSVPLLYFSRKNSSTLFLGKTKFDKKALLKVCANGSSEFMTNISMAIVNTLYNVQLLRYAGEDGVAAYGAMMYVSMIFIAIFLGYSNGSGPIVSYHYGAKNIGELKQLLRKSLVIILTSSFFMFLFAYLLSSFLSNVFVGYDKELFDMTNSGFKIFSFSFLFSGFAIYGSSFFTALNDGLTSALISFLRTLVFEILSVLLLPLILGLNGIWLSIVVAEVMAVVVTLFFFYRKRSVYGY